jgi:hypothetical protein
MRSLIVVGLLAVAAATLPVRVANAAPPYPPNCFVSRPLIACPAGDLTSTFILRTAINVPEAYADVSLSFENCPSVRFPTPIGDESYVLAAGMLIATTNMEGRLELGMRAGGGCPADAVPVYGSGVLIARRALASPDQDGNLGVTAGDVALAESKLGSADPTADFDGDGTVSSLDIQLVRAHLGHVAPGPPVPVASRTWGTLKLTYR